MFKLFRSLFSHRQFRLARGFSLVEAAIVLGVVGLVIGGIWVAASEIRYANKINNTAKNILLVAENARRVLPFSAYPSTLGVITSVTGLAGAAGIFPADFTTPGGVAVSADNAQFFIGMACWNAAYPHPNCPMLQVVLYGTQAAGSRGLTTAECLGLIRKVAGLLKQSSNLYYVQISSSSVSNYQMLYPPFSGDTVDCPANLSSISFWFHP